MVQKTEACPQVRSVQKALEEELARLKRTVAFEEALTVRWDPRQKDKISGEVIGDTIYVYEENPQEAMNTLRHEYLDGLFTRKLVEPLIAMVNAFIKVKEMEIYREKERIVTSLQRLL